MKYFLLLLPFLLIYVFTKPEETIEIKATTPPDKVEAVHIDDSRPQSAPEANTGLASWYDRSACGEKIYGVDCKTANGEVFSETGNTLACSSRFRLGDRIRICYLGRCIDTICSDRGNFERLGRDFDLSRGAFSSLAPLDRGVIEVEWEVIVKDIVEK